MLLCNGCAMLWAACDGGLWYDSRGGEGEREGKRERKIGQINEEEEEGCGVDTPLQDLPTELISK